MCGEFISLHPELHKVLDIWKLEENKRQPTLQARSKYYREEDEEKKNEKICLQRTNKQINVSNTETTLILCGYSRERANIFGTKDLITITSLEWELGQLQAARIF